MQSKPTMDNGELLPDY